MFQHGVIRLLMAMLIGTWVASSGGTVLAQEHDPEPSVPPQEGCINCPHRGVEGIGETITEVGSQKCPRVTLGIHIPFVGD